MYDDSQQTGGIISFLNEYLPFSANALNSIQEYSERTKIFRYGSPQDPSYAVEFISGYNPHIWFSPILWVFPAGNMNKSLERLLRSAAKRNSRFIALAPYVSDDIIPEFTDFKFYKERLMILKDFQSERTLKYEIKKLHESSAEQSLNLSAEVEPLSAVKSTLAAERQFLRERETYGIFLDSKLVCRGSIMANSGGFYSIGGFVTHRDYRRKGLAGDLIWHICKLVRERNGVPFLTVRDDNYAAIPLYRNLGFRELETISFIDYHSGVVP